MLVIREWLEIHQQKNRGQVVGIYYIRVRACVRACSTVRLLVFNSLAASFAEVCANQTMTWVIDTGL